MVDVGIYAVVAWTYDDSAQGYVVYGMESGVLVELGRTTTISAVVDGGYEAYAVAPFTGTEVGAITWAEGVSCVRIYGPGHDPLFEVNEDCLV